MADHMDENAASPVNRSLSQKAVDAAPAEMRIDRTEEAQAATDKVPGEEAISENSHDPEIAAGNAEPAAHANGGETFGESEIDDQAELDAAIAAMQADVEAERMDGSDSGEASQEDIDAAIAAMHAGESADAEAREFEGPAAATRCIDPPLTGRQDFTDRPSAETETADPGLLSSDPDEFKELDELNAAPAADIDRDEPGEIETVSDILAYAPTAKAVETLGVATEKRAAHKAKAESSPKAGLKKKRWGILAVSLIVLTAAGAFFGRDLYSKYIVKSSVPTEQVSEPEPSRAKTAPEPARVETPEDPYYEKLQEVARLRADLLAKKTEIDQLRQFYRDGISELAEEVQQEVARHGVQKLSQALSVNKIRLDLESIQRRWAYIDELAKPYHWLDQGSEELLFLSRRTEIDLQMNSVADGIELTKHMRHLNACLQKYQLLPDRLAIEIGASRPRPLEEIWQMLAAESKDIARQVVSSADQEIIEEICGGNTGRIAELGTLTIKASKCLAQIEARELFLNQLTTLSPLAAKYLSNWKGQWLCLNGFKELTPEVARHLFRWHGNWISLNGLKDFEPRIGELLLSWDGDQLELMGLEFKANQADRIGLQQLAEWERAGGKLFVPEAIRVEIDKLG